MTALVEGTAELCALMAYDQKVPYPWGDRDISTEDLLYLQEVLGRGYTYQEKELFSRIVVEHFNWLHELRVPQYDDEGNVIVDVT